MEQAVETQTAHGPKFTLNIEGRDVPWNSDTITTEVAVETRMRVETRAAGARSGNAAPSAAARPTKYSR